VILSPSINLGGLGGTDYFLHYSLEYQSGTIFF